MEVVKCKIIEEKVEKVAMKEDVKEKAKENVMKWEPKKVRGSDLCQHARFHLCVFSKRIPLKDLHSLINF